jgi:GMP synthase (glutamine-hydrolysing)
VRCLGELSKEKLDILRHADAIFREEIKSAGLDEDIWQYFAALPNFKAVGLKDGARRYAHCIVLRAVLSSRALTATAAQIPYPVLSRVADRIMNEISEVSRVLYDISDKPPGTIEFE